MKNGIALVVVTCWTLVGCASSSYYVGGPGANLSFESAEKQITGKEATIVLRDAEADEGRVLQLAPDSILWVSAKHDAIRSARLSSVSRVVLPPSTDRRVFGGITGFFGGGLAGGILAAAIVEGMDDFNTEVSVALVLGVGGMVCGTIFGATSGSESEYMFSGAPPLIDRGPGAVPRSDYYVLRLTSLMDESASTVTIFWNGAPRVISKARILMEPQEGGGYVLKIPKALLGE
jgi:hypothetical protein